MEFPISPKLICRKCLATFFPDESALLCPCCGHSDNTPPSYIEKLFRFYPRLKESIPAMQNNGFLWLGYGIYRHPMVPMYGMENLTFGCVACDGHFKVPFNSVDKLSSEPGLFFCPKCKKHPTLNKVTKEFFVCVKTLNQCTWRFTAFQWDIFQPIGLDPAESEIQSRIYRLPQE